jgi:phosphoenolpyruvate synthase/pyruvate phosphate dikinase
MNPVIPLDQIRDEDRNRVGGKAFSLARLFRSHVNVPDAICINTEAYNDYITSTGLCERVLFELNRKSFDEMRWEEMWDASLRIRNTFLNTPIPAELLAILTRAIDSRFSGRAVVVRSSAPGEDSAKASFAGLHESYVNVRGTTPIIEHIHLVWASLWSDAALLYRQELGLDVERSTMAVVVQEIVLGDRSGVAFGKNPNDPSQAVIEAVYGLNQGLVDGTVEPDRWILDRKTGGIISYTPAHRGKAVFPARKGVQLQQLPSAKLNTPPLDHGNIAQIFDHALAAETLFGEPQDMEWTFRGDMLYVIQSRPITTGLTADSGDKRSWYLGLRRSFENLKELRRKIEGELIPAMIEEAAQLSHKDLKKLSTLELVEEIKRRSAIYDKWLDVYWNEFIPFAHGARLFGQVYNDAVRPADPYEFMDLLKATNMASLERNRMLEDMASMIRENPQLAEALRNGKTDTDEEFDKAFDTFVSKFGDLFRGMAESKEQYAAITGLLLKMAGQSAAQRPFQPKDVESLEGNFLSRFEGEKKAEAAELLHLARTSYQLRDDDNIHLGRIKGQMLAGIEEAKRRIEERPSDGVKTRELASLLQDPQYVLNEHASADQSETDYRIKARQVVGQPAGPGIARGKARVINDPSDVFGFNAGEILVCDAVDPTMTFVVPLSAGIVERRGGMLIHGAIIAREYGLPCVTGVPDATSLIHTGDQLTVDGYLGIIIIGETIDSAISVHESTVAAL